MALWQLIYIPLPGEYLPDQRSSAQSSVGIVLWGRRVGLSGEYLIKGPLLNLLEEVCYEEGGLGCRIEDLEAVEDVGPALLGQEKLIFISKYLKYPTVHSIDSL